MCSREGMGTGCVKGERERYDDKYENWEILVGGAGKEGR